MTRQPKIEKTFTVTRASVVARIGKILNMMAKVRYDGNNARYVSHIVPKIDFEQEKDLINDILKDSIGRLAKRIKCFLTSVVTETPTPTGTEDTTPPGATPTPTPAPTPTGTEDTTQYVLSLSFAHDWASQLEGTLKDKINEYLAYQVIALWLEMTSPADMEYYGMKAKDLLHEVRHTCEMKNNVIHTIEYITD